MRRGSYCIYKKDGKEYSCGDLTKTNIVIASENKEKMKENFLKEMYKNWRGEEEYSYYKIVPLEELDDIYYLNYKIKVNGAIGDICGYEKVSKEIVTSSEKEHEKYKSMFRGRAEWDVYVPIDEIENFIEIKKHIGPFEYMGEEKTELPNTEEILNFIFTTFPN